MIKTRPLYSWLHKYQLVPFFSHEPTVNRRFNKRHLLFSIWKLRPKGYAPIMTEQVAKMRAWKWGTVRPFKFKVKRLLKNLLLFRLDMAPASSVRMTQRVQNLLCTYETRDANSYKRHHANSGWDFRFEEGFLGQFNIICPSPEILDDLWRCLDASD